MKVIVTGGAGFIGSNLAERLLKHGHALSVVDDMNEYYPPRLKWENLQAVRNAGDICFHKADICDEATILQIFHADPPEVVIHLAARAGVQPSIKEPLLYERVNVRGTIVLLEACRRFGVRKFVFASSSSVYGTSNSVPFREEDCLESPISPYGATKIAAEKMCFTYSHLYHLQVTCLRLFTVYGPRQRPDLAIRKFIEKIDDGHPITVFGDGRTARDLTFIDDTVDGILAALAYDSSWDVFNLGNARPVSLNSLIATIEECLGKKAKIQRLPSQPGDMLITHGDISKAHRLLGYSPATLLTDGLYRTIAWCRSVDKSAKV